MAISFRSCQTKAVDWVDDTCFEVLDADVEDRKLTFIVANRPEISFYVVVPETDKDVWLLWSEKDAVLSKIQTAIDYTGNCQRKSVTDILAKCYKDLAEHLGADDGGGDSDMEEDMDDFMDEEDVQQEKLFDPAEEELNKQFSGSGSSPAVMRLIKDLKAMNESQGKYGVKGTPRGDNLFIWDVQLNSFPAKSKLAKDLKLYADKYKREACITMEMKFPQNYPLEPPFVRVIRPRFEFMTGHVTIGGSICTEMLTRSGWRPTNDIESMLVQIRSEIMSDTKVTLAANPDKEYTFSEAEQAFKRMVAKYGWDK